LKNFWTTLLIKQKQFIRISKVTVKNGSANATVDKLYSNVSKRYWLKGWEQGDSRNIWLEIASGTIGHWKTAQKIGDYVCYKAISVVKVAEKTLQIAEDQRLKIV
jgi:hypothetical protein